jgi:hypothetical protein
VGVATEQRHKARCGAEPEVRIHSPPAGSLLRTPIEPGATLGSGSVSTGIRPVMAPRGPTATPTAGRTCAGVDRGLRFLVERGRRGSSICQARLPDRAGPGRSRAYRGMHRLRLHDRRLPSVQCARAGMTERSVRCGGRRRQKCALISRQSGEFRPCEAKLLVILAVNRSAAIEFRCGAPR